MKLIEELRDIKSGPKELRQFCWVIGMALLVMAVIGGLRWHPFFALAAFPGAILIGLAVVESLTKRPVCVLVQPAQRAWMALAVCLGFVVSRILLSLIYLVVLGAMRLVAIVVRKPLLDKHGDPALDSYWRPCETPESMKEHMERQF